MKKTLVELLEDIMKKTNIEDKLKFALTTGNWGLKPKKNNNLFMRLNELKLLSEMRYIKPNKIAEQKTSTNQIDEMYEKYFNILIINYKYFHKINYLILFNI